MILRGKALSPTLGGSLLKAFSISLSLSLSLSLSINRHREQHQALLALLKDLPLLLALLD